MKKEGLKYVILQYFITRRSYKVRIYSTCLLDTGIAFVHVIKKVVLFSSLQERSCRDIKSPRLLLHEIRTIPYRLYLLALQNIA